MLVFCSYLWECVLQPSVYSLSYLKIKFSRHFLPRPGLRFCLYGSDGGSGQPLPCSPLPFFSPLPHLCQAPSSPPSPSPLPAGRAPGQKHPFSLDRAKKGRTKHGLGRSFNTGKHYFFLFLESYFPDPNFSQKSRKQDGPGASFLAFLAAFV